MTPPSLREICAKATPGPWKLLRLGQFGWVDVRGADGKALAFTGTRRENFEVVEGQAVDEINAALIARLSPATALAVYEALENSERVLRGAALTIEDFSPYKAESAARKVVLEQADQVKAALRLLDGRTEP